MIWKILSITNNYLDKDEKEEVYIKIKKKTSINFDGKKWMKYDWYFSLCLLDIYLNLFPSHSL